MPLQLRFFYPEFVLRSCWKTNEVFVSNKPVQAILSLNSASSTGEFMECFLVFAVVIFAGFIQLILTALAKFQLIDSDIEFDGTDS